MKSLESATDAIDYAATTAVDLIAAGGGPCRAIMPRASGNLVIITVRTGATRTIAVTQDVLEPIQATNITVANAIACRVYW